LQVRRLQAINQYNVQIYGVVKWLDSIGLILEYMPCGNLAQFLNDDSPLRFCILVILRLFYELAVGLAFMHNRPGGRQLVHGNLKPENVLLTSDFHCKLSDLGRLTALTDSKAYATSAYASPEKLKSLNITATKEQDTYSFGMILYAILSGFSPSHRVDHESAFKQTIISGERPEEESIDELRANLTEHQQQILDVLRSMMRRCWAQEPSDRPTMLEVRDELKSLLEQQSEETMLLEEKEVLDTLHLSFNHDENPKTFLPLHIFSPKDRRFTQGSDLIVSQIEFVAIQLVFSLFFQVQRSLQCFCVQV